MTRKILISLILSLVVNNNYPEGLVVNSNYPEEVIKFKIIQPSKVDVLIKAISMVESAGKVNVINHKEKAYGHLQIRSCVIEDVNHYFNTNYKITCALDSLKSIDIFMKYQYIYNREFNLEKASRIWNGGPKGMNKKVTEKYWEKVMNNYNKIIQENIKIQLITNY